jgi:hypothetical protein
VLRVRVSSCFSSSLPFLPFFPPCTIRRSRGGTCWVKPTYRCGA